MNRNDGELALTISGVIIGIGLVAFIIFIAPWLSFWLAYFSGWIAKITIGKSLIAGLELIGLTIPIDKIPLLAGTIGWIGGFFKSVNFARNKKNSDY